MPPKASNFRRGGSQPANEKEPSKLVAGVLHKPQLPKLQGAVGTKRQFSYGADEEPEPMRPRAQDGEVFDLRFAVQDALGRHEIAEEEEEVFIQRPAVRPRAAKAAAVAAITTPKAKKLTRAQKKAEELRNNNQQQDAQLMPPPPPAIREMSVEASDNDDARSFAMESDFFGDATIASTPGTAAPVAEQLRAARALSPFVPTPQHQPQPQTSVLKQKPIRFPIAPRPDNSSPATQLRESLVVTRLADLYPNVDPTDDRVQITLNGRHMTTNSLEDIGFLMDERLRLERQLALDRQERQKRVEDSAYVDRGPETDDSYISDNVSDHLTDSQQPTPKPTTTTTKPRRWNQQDPLYRDDGLESEYSDSAVNRRRTRKGNARRAGADQSEQGGEDSDDPIAPQKNGVTRNASSPAINAAQQPAQAENSNAPKSKPSAPPFNPFGRTPAIPAAVAAGAGAGAATSNPILYPDLSREPLRRLSGNGDSNERRRQQQSQQTSSSGLLSKAKQLVASVSPFANNPNRRARRDAAQAQIQAPAQAPDGENQQEDDAGSWFRPIQNIGQTMARVIPRGDVDNQDQVEEEVEEEEEVEDEDEDEEEQQEDDGAFSWWRLLNPYTYFQALVWALESIYDSIYAGLQYMFPLRVRNMLQVTFGYLLYATAFFVTAATIVGLVRSTVPAFAGDDPDFGLRWPSVPSIQLPDTDALFRRVGDYIPSIPWPLIRRSSQWLPDHWNLEDVDTTDLLDYMRKYEQDNDILKETAKLHQESLKKMQELLPKLIHVNVKDGKPVVADEFWHALRDVIRADDGFFTLEKKGNSYEIKSEKQAKAIAARLAKEKAFTDAMDNSIKTVEDKLEHSIPAHWDKWVRNNDEKIGAILGSALDRIKSAGSTDEFDKKLKEIVKQHVDDTKQHVVSREEFLRHLNNEFATHRAEVRAELAQMKPVLDDLARQAAQLVAEELPKPLTRGEITTLVHGMVQKAMTDLNIEGIAKGKIHSHWDRILKHQINYFGPGSGASIDAKHTSKTLKVKVPTKEQIMKGHAIPRHSTPMGALTSWNDDGDRWCAVRSKSRRGNPHGAILSIQMGHRVIPQHIVIEHILPEATFDADARPKDIEVYAYVDADIRDHVRDFAATHLPDDTSDWNFTPAELPEAFVKIGQFMYEEHQPHEGLQIHRLSSELTEMGVVTDHVMIRAISNYGAKDYTCFYRVRLFGQAIEAI